MGVHLEIPKLVNCTVLRPDNGDDEEDDDDEEEEDENEDRDDEEEGEPLWTR